MRAELPQRNVCLTEEPTEILYLLGEQDRIVGISGFTVRPPQARKEKPKVSAFTSAKIDKILDLKPDLVVGFSDLQAEISSKLIRAGAQVLIFNQRSVQEILNVILTMGSIVGVVDRAAALVGELITKMRSVETAAQALSRRPKVYFEEWNDPLISGIRWVSELIHTAGGEDCFIELSQHPNAKQRIIIDPSEVVRRDPDIIIGSWCGKRFVPQHVSSRPGWDQIQAVRDGQLHEIKSPIILQPGPAALTDGLQELHDIIQRWQ